MSELAIAGSWVAPLAFLIGSIPFGLLVGRFAYKSDIRTAGSGNIGAANALRTYGRAGGAAVLLLDALKGAAAVLLARAATAGDAGADVAAFAAFAGCIAVAGHCYSIFLGFKGGKGVATWLGVVTTLAWPLALVFVGVWLILVLPTRWASLGSLSATVVSAGGIWFVTHDAGATAWALAAAALIVLKHRENIGRLLAGSENRIGFGKATRA
jgi:glycerol-3-phosphate acyltransferase PlsY